MSSSSAVERAAVTGPWVAVVPVKPFARAKTRLAPLGDDVRRDLAAALAHDTLAALVDCEAVALVVVVTDELSLARSIDLPGVVAVPDGHGGDLNATLVQGAAEGLRRHPAARLVAVCADLPALAAGPLAAFLAGAPDVADAFVPDASGLGTTTYVARDLASFAPSFGVGSAQAHRAAGATDLAGIAPPGLRHDVDSPADLDDVLALGAGERTRWTVTRHGIGRQR